MGYPRTRGKALVLGATIVALAAACAALFRPREAKPRPFNHAAHLERGLECISCHSGAEREAKAGMPSKELCNSCHEELDREPGRPREKTVAWFLDERGEPRWSEYTRQSSEIRFSHAAHAAKKVDCLACHSGMDKNTGIVPSVPQRMDSCVSCHRKDDCSTCHTGTARDRSPANHERGWQKLHGLCARQGRGSATANDCTLCHRSDSCVTCHQTKPPADHTNFWRHAGHGVAAKLDRERCRTCHQSDSCVACHQETAPRNHRGDWNAPRNRHCTSCHLPLSTQSGSCITCHKSTPGHDSAPAKPAWHNAAMNCRSCHTISLKHPDNGDNCNSCHQ